MMRKIIAKVLQFFFSLLDKTIPKDNSIWVFGIGKNHRLNGNLRFFYDYCTGKDFITTLVSYDKNDEYLYVKSVKAMILLLRAGVVIVQYKVRDIYWNIGRSPKRSVVNLWHSTTVKGFHNLNEFVPVTSRQFKTLRKESEITSYFISSSKTDRTAMAAAYGVPLRKVLLTGLPRNDFFTMEMIPRDLERQEHILVELKGDRKLILYAPTFRSSDSGAYVFSFEERNLIDELSEKYNCLFGIRSHPGIKDVKQKNFIFLDSDSFPETQVILKHTDVLISDYSGIWVDFLILDKPVIGFLYDYQSYESSVSSVIYDLEHFFPGQVAGDFGELYKAVATALIDPEKYLNREVKMKRQLYLKYKDSFCQRLFQQLTGAEE